MAAMGTAQSAICPEAGPFGIFITLRLAGGPTAVAACRRGLAQLPERLAGAAANQPGLVAAIGIGAACWPSLVGAPAPRELVPFEPLAAGHRVAPATAADLFLHIHSDSHDTNFMLARAVLGDLGPAVSLVEEVHGFRHLEGRDLTGFVDGTENPKGDDRAAVALVGDEDPAFAGGSYVSVQRWVHDLGRWEKLPVPEQEGVIGRTKADDVELADDVKPPTAHIARVVIEENGAELELLRHSMPYGGTAEAGLYFVAYGRRPHAFRRMLERMVLPDDDGLYDHLMDYSRPVTGAAFFVPPLETLVGLGG